MLILQYRTFNICTPLYRLQSWVSQFQHYDSNNTGHITSDTLIPLLGSLNVRKGSFHQPLSTINQ